MSNGLKVARHSRLTYLGADLAEISGSFTEGSTTLGKHPVLFTIHDDLIEKEYLEVLLPTAVNYAVECLDYFFRGSGIRGTYFDWNSAAQSMEIHVGSNNWSGYKSGLYQIYWDDDDGNRTLLTTIPYDPNSETKAFIQPIEGDIRTRKCTVVFKGTLSPLDTLGVDPIDDGRAIAGGTATLWAGLQFLATHTTLNVTFAGITNSNPMFIDVSALNGTQIFTLDRAGRSSNEDTYYVHYVMQEPLPQSVYYPGSTFQHIVPMR